MKKRTLLIAAAFAALSCLYGCSSQKQLRKKKPRPKSLRTTERYMNSAPVPIRHRLEPSDRLLIFSAKQLKKNLVAASKQPLTMEANLEASQNRWRCVRQAL